MSLTLLSPCKINLYLDVLSPRPDGYHEIVTVMEPVALFDRLIVSEIPGGIDVSCDRAEIPDGKGNIVYRAAECLRERAGLSRGIAVRIEKRVPAGAGLGGGSADAAVALRALNQIWKARLPEDALKEIAARLGSDVPFFLDPRTSLCRGRGEIISPLPPAPPFWMVLIHPGVDVSTRWAYGELDRARRRPAPPLEPLIESLPRGTIREIAPLLYNAFEEAVAKRHPEVSRALSFLMDAGALRALMSGSGSTAVGIAESREEAQIIARRARETLPPAWTVVAVPNLSACPVPKTSTN
jgi:4-diphosphocytidyl-2-C-methyl-D-erythritol kinase